MSVLDWIAMAEEVYRNFDATSMDCQKRLVCELHQNENLGHRPLEDERRRSATRSTWSC